ncbi:hypothetical protein MycrhDRAFT_6896 [Mycolicibacterium rhodesiae JS60]|nr:hypothetical protein MycrhDRAFT_6896 [Mycolicibacterium rhodesiae JS60]
MSEIVATEGTTPEGTPTPAPVAEPKPMEPEPKVYDEAYVRELRQEAAKHRTSKNEAVDAAVTAAKEAHAAELAARDVRIGELENELGAAWIELEKYQVTVAAKVPSDKVEAFRAILQGTDKDSITESAKSAYALAGGFSATSPAYDPSHGFGGGKPPIPLNGDRILQALTAKLGVK